MNATRVALINMPWYSVKLSCISLAVLKRALRRKRIAADVYHLNLQLASRMNLKVYEEISDLLFIGDWLFSQHLFGEFGTGEVKNSCADLLRDPRTEISKAVSGLNIDFLRITNEVIPDFINECLTSVPWNQYEIVAFTSMFTQHAPSLLLAKRIKDVVPHTKVVFGGANLEGVMGYETLRAFEWIDYVVDGEGEKVFPQLAQNILRGEPCGPLPGVSFRQDGRVSVSQSRAPATPMNQIPVPDYSDFYRQLRECGLDDRTQTMILFESARGCWWGEKSHCTFCGLNGQSMKFRVKAPRRVLREILALASRHQFLDFQAVDNIMDMRYFSSLLPQLAAKQLDLHLFYELKTNLKKEQVKLLRSSGVRYLQAGVESLNSEILRMMRKGVTAFQNIQFLKWCQEFRLHLNWNYLYGFPGESPKQYESILDTIFSITHLPPPTAPHKIIVDRFSPYFTQPAEFGIERIVPSPFYEYIYPAGKINLDRLAFHFNYCFSNGQETDISYITPFKKAVALWRELYRNRRVYFYHRQGPAFTELLDNRPLPGIHPNQRHRRIVLRGAESKIYTACESGKSFKEICRLQPASDGSVLQEGQIRAILNRFVENRLMFSENDRYLSLALPYKHG